MNQTRILRAVVDSAAGGSLTIVSGTSGKTIRILGLDLNTASSTTIQFKSGSTALTGAMTVTSKHLDPIVMNDQMVPWFTCASGEAFVITMGGAVQISGVVLYTKE